MIRNVVKEGAVQKMAVLKLKPACKDYLWGGTRLMKEFGKAFAGERLAETWELSWGLRGWSVSLTR